MVLLNNGRSSYYAPTTAISNGDLSNDNSFSFYVDSGVLKGRYRDGASSYSDLKLTSGFTGTGAYTNFTIVDGVITAAS